MKTKLLYNEVDTLILQGERNSFTQFLRTKVNRLKEFSLDQRLALVKEGQTRNISVRKLCLREGISLRDFQTWTTEFLSSPKEDVSFPKIKKIRNEDFMHTIVMEGLNGVSSVPEICRRENISSDEFLTWSKDVLRNSNVAASVGNVGNESKHLIDAFFHGVSLDVKDYFESFVNLHNSKNIVLKASNHNLEKEDNVCYDNILNTFPVNDVRFINKYFEKINLKMKDGAFFLGCFETFSARQDRMKVSRFNVLNRMYFAGEFLVKRILPKLSLTKSLYFNFTHGKDRLLSKAEGLGRLVSCGFKIVDYKSINGLLYFVVKKDTEPLFDMNPSYGPIYKMPRLGRNGKIIKVYKLRTMHPYSEYLQDFVLRINGYSETGKPAEDFRIPYWGKIMRRYWLDELPQLINVLKGEMKLVGVRPVSKRYFQDVPREMQKLRLTQKPGCIPPYVSLNRDGNVMSVLQAEKEYLEEKIKNPFTTDIKYFLKAVINIILKNKRSA